jgi:hypothetical protein
MKITKGRLKQIIKEEVENFSSEITENDASLDSVKGMLATVAQGLLREPPVLPSEQECEDLYRGLKSIARKEEPTPELEDGLGDMGAINE